MRTTPRLVTLFVATLLLPLLHMGVANAADAGYQGPSYRDNNVQVPTDDKSQSKLWFQDGRWWGLLYNSSRHSTDIYGVDLATHEWTDTGTVVDTRPTARGDALWDGSKLYIVSGTTVVSEYGVPPNPDDVAAGSALLSRYSYDPSTRTYTLDPGFPATVHQGSTESITLAKDSTGMLWATYTLVSPDNTSKVYVVHTTSGDTTWGTPSVVPTTAGTVHYDDISAIVAFQGNKIGIMWSNQLTAKFYFAVHNDGAPDSSWQTEVAYGGGVGGCSSGCANDHINLKQLSNDGSGRVFVAIKTANRNTGQPFVVLLGRDRHAAWSAYRFGAVEDLHTRPMVMIDEEHRELFMFAVSPEVGGTIYYKKSSLDQVSFPAGAGTPFIQSGLDTDISNPTSTKQNVNSATGLVVLASANAAAHYRHNYLDLSQESAPAPAAPTNTAVAAAVTSADSTLSLSWSDNSTTEDGFAVERRTGTGAYAEITRTGGNVSAYTDAGLTPGTTYTYRVRAFNAVGYSTYDSEASGTTAQTGPVRTFLPVADAYVDSGAPASKLGSGPTLAADASPVQESYLKFQLTGLTGNTVTDAKLRMYVSDNGSVKGGSVAKMGNTAWIESTVTYNSRPAIDGAALSSLGAVSIGTWYQFSVTAAVTGDGTLSLGVKTASTDGAHYASREDAAHAPQLVVTVAAGDTIPPETTITSGPSGLVSSTSASFAFSSSEVGSTFECSRDEGAFAACTSPQAYTGLAEGAHTFQVRAIDGSGNVDPTPVGASWTSDTVAPSTILEPSVPDASSSASASFSFTSDEAQVSFACRLDGAAFSACTSPQTYAGLADGSHTFTSRATDAVGNVEQSPPSRTWAVDTVAPNTTISAGPQGQATLTTASFSFSSNEALATFECSLDNAAWTGCSSPQSYDNLVPGSHTFQVRATDASGNVDPTPDARDWTIDTTIADTTPPTVTLTAPNDGQLVRGTTNVSADAADDQAVDHVDFMANGTLIGPDATAPYTTSWASANGADGPVTLTAVAVDTSGNATTSASAVVTVDNSPPETTITSGPPAAVSSGSASLGFTSDDASAAFQCSLDGSAFASCASPATFTGLPDGGHTFSIRASDAAGNVDPTPAVRTWTVDTVAPDTTVNAGPSSTVISRSATLTFSSNETASFECSLDGAAFLGCASFIQYTGLADGPHQFLVRATDPAGNVDATPASWTWTVDPVAFSEGFESGDFSKWSSVRKTIDGTAVVQSSMQKSGTYAAQITAPSSTSYAYIRKTLAASQTDLTVSGDFDITTEGISGQEVPIFKLYDASGVRVLYVYRRNVSGRIYAVYGGTTYPSSAKLALGNWASFNVHAVAAGTAGKVDVTMNGVSIYGATGANLGSSGVRTIQIGNDKQLPFALYADNVSARI